MKKNRPISLLAITLFLGSYSCNTTIKEDKTEHRSIVQPTAIYKDTVEIKNKKSRTAIYLESLGLVNIHSLDSTINIDLKYSTTDNFTKTILYEDLEEAYLTPLGAQKLIKAQKLLRKINSNYSLLIYDAARPMSVQKKMYAVVQDTKYKAYVANPTRTGLHNYGMAVDLTIYDSIDNLPLDMGTSFDYFGKAAGINDEEEFERQRILTREQIKNRKLLRKVMIEADFLTIRGEWWHFNAVSLGQAKKTAKVIE